MRRAFLKGVPFKSAPQRAEPSPSEDFVLSAQNKISEYFHEVLWSHL